VPVYESQCPTCAATAEYLRAVADCLDTPDCPECGVRMVKKVFSAPKGYVRGKFEAFKSSVDGTIIANHRDMQEHNRRNDVVCLADGYSDEKVRAGQAIQPLKQEKSDVAADLGAALIAVRDGYRPEVQHEN